MEKFKKILVHAYENVPFYSDKYNMAGIDPYSINTTDDISKIPILTKEEIRENFPDKILSKGINLDRCIISSTSGSTTIPLQYAVSPSNQYARDAVHEYVHNFVGCTKHHKLVHLITLHEGCCDKVEGNRNRYRVFSSYKNVDFHIKLFNKMKPDFLKACTSYLIALGSLLEDVKYDFRKPLTGIITTGELLTLQMKNEIERLFNTEVFDSYGAGETADLACECDMHNGMHEIMEHAYIEIICDGKPAIDNQAGKIIVTDLDNYSMPIIRYDVGDVALRSSNLCNCGSTSPLLKKIYGRFQDFLMSKNGELIPPFILRGGDSPFNNEPLCSILDKYQIFQNSDRSITVFLVTNSTISNEIKNNLTRFIQDRLGDINVSFEIVEDIPSENYGKFRFVISKAKKESIRNA
ncbi:MAG: hypothetical protein P9M11_00550 [Candidatus Tenebribacter burtonii]|nr:hypothetical protein [Candidatus Tenebribacter burtonii]